MGEGRERRPVTRSTNMSNHASARRRRYEISTCTTSTRPSTFVHDGDSRKAAAPSFYRAGRDGSRERYPIAALDFTENGGRCPPKGYLRSTAAAGVDQTKVVAGARRRAVYPSRRRSTDRSQESSAEDVSCSVDANSRWRGGRGSGTGCGSDWSGRGGELRSSQGRRVAGWGGGFRDGRTDSTWENGSPSGGAKLGRLDDNYEGTRGERPRSRSSREKGKSDGHDGGVQYWGDGGNRGRGRGRAGGGTEGGAADSWGARGYYGGERPRSREDEGGLSSSRRRRNEGGEDGRWTTEDDWGTEGGSKRRRRDVDSRVDDRYAAWPSGDGKRAFFSRREAGKDYGKSSRDEGGPTSLQVSTSSRDEGGPTSLQVSKGSYARSTNYDNDNRRQRSSLVQASQASSPRDRRVALPRVEAGKSARPSPRYSNASSFFAHDGAPVASSPRRRLAASSRRRGGGERGGRSEELRTPVQSEALSRRQQEQQQQQQQQQEQQQEHEHEPQDEGEEGEAEDELPRHLLGKKPDFKAEGGGLSAELKFASNREEDPHRIAQRQKQIDFGKNTTGYDRYMLAFSKSKRPRGAPSTPNKHEKMSKRRWDGKIRSWRRQLHMYDVATAEGSSWNTSSSDPNSESFGNEDSDVLGKEIETAQEAMEEEVMAEEDAASGAGNGGRGAEQTSWPAADVSLSPDPFERQEKVEGTQQQYINAGIYSDGDDGDDGFGGSLSHAGGRGGETGGAAEEAGEGGSVTRERAKKTRNGAAGAGRGAATSTWGTSVDYWSGDSASDEDESGDEDEGLRRKKRHRHGRGPGDVRNPKLGGGEMLGRGELLAADEEELEELAERGEMERNVESTGKRVDGGTAVDGGSDEEGLRGGGVKQEAIEATEMDEVELKREAEREAGEEEKADTGVLKGEMREAVEGTWTVGEKVGSGMEEVVRELQKLDSDEDAFSDDDLL